MGEQLELSVGRAEIASAVGLGSPPPAPVTTPDGRPVLHSRVPVPSADALAMDTRAVLVGQINGEWTRLAIRPPHGRASAWKNLVASEGAYSASASGVRLRLYQRGGRCVWDSADGAFR